MVSRTSLNQRRALRRLVQPRGLGVVFSTDRKRTTEGIVRWFERQASELGSPPFESSMFSTDMSVDDFNRRVESGNITLGEFQETSFGKNILAQYGPNVGHDIVQASYYDYLLSFPSLSGKARKDIEFARAVTLRQATRKLKVRDASEIPRDVKIARQTAGDLYRKELARFNRLTGLAVAQPRGARPVVSKDPARVPTGFYAPRSSIRTPVNQQDLVRIGRQVPGAISTSVPTLFTPAVETLPFKASTSASRDLSIFRQQTKEAIRRANRTLIGIAPRNTVSPSQRDRSEELRRFFRLFR